MKKNNKGFSLVELMIALAISGIVMTALVLLVVQSVNGYGKQTALAQIQSDVDVSLNQISKNVLEADLIKLIKTDDGNIRCYLKKSDDANMWGYYYNKAEKTLKEIMPYLEKTDVTWYETILGQAVLENYIDLILENPENKKRKIQFLT